ncbi:MAG: hypothetical protein KJ645_07375, partial [Planctomycetes bacterium]|nr:hypothetical protein [Planctomycetota bacterium]
MIQLDQASDYRHFLEVLGKRELARGYRLNHASGALSQPPGSDFFLIAEELGKEGVPIVLKPVLDFKPLTTNRYNLPAMLEAAGCEIVLIPAEDTPMEHARFLNRVGHLVKTGLSREQALKAITL